MRIIDCFVAVFDSPESESPESDVLCKVITISQETLTQGTGEYMTTETYQAAYVLNPETGEVQRVRLVDIIINSYYSDDKIKELTVIGKPLRVGEERGSNEVGHNHPNWDNDSF